MLEISQYFFNFGLGSVYSDIRFSRFHIESRSCVDNNRVSRCFATSKLKVKFVVITLPIVDHSYRALKEKNFMLHYEVID